MLASSIIRAMTYRYNPALIYALTLKQRCQDLQKITGKVGLPIPVYSNFHENSTILGIINGPTVEIQWDLMVPIVPEVPLLEDGVAQQ